MSRVPVYLGVDIGGTTTEAVVTDHRGRVVGVGTVPTLPGSEGVLRSTERATVQALESAGVSWGDAISCGVGVPGLVDRDSGVVEVSVNLDLVHVDLPALLARVIPLPLHVDNDVNMAAVGAVHVLRVRAPSVTFLNLGTGIRAATLLDGVVLRGATSSAGELGHLGSSEGRQLCPCGQYDCPEVLYGGPAVRHLLAPQTGDRSADAWAALAGERAAMVGGLADVVKSLALAYDPALIIAGGGVVSHAPWLIPAVRSELRDRGARSSFLTALDIAGRLVALPDGSHAPAVGAAIACHDGGESAARHG